MPETTLESIVCSFSQRAFWFFGQGETKPRAGLYARVSADIPFDFMVGGTEFKAGRYSVDRLYSSNPDGALKIRSLKDSSMANFSVVKITDKGKPQARLVFNRYGNQYFLSQIFDGLSGGGSQLIKSKAEREAAKKRDTITQNAAKPEIVTVGAQSGHTKKRSSMAPFVPRESMFGVERLRLP